MTNKRLYNDSVKQTLDSVEITEERYHSITTTLSTKKKFNHPTLFVMTELDLHRL